MNTTTTNTSPAAPSALVTHPDQVSTPMHDKLLAVADDSHVIGEFLDWLPTRDLHLGTPSEDGERLHFAHPDIEKLLAAFFGIDLGVLEAEKQALLAAQRALNDSATGDTTRSGQ
ncbi:hypothetical protein [Saccharothrix sp. HUAS TT1]|uniref:hypothetical protein n=1 Tax=unclassified Saccharothrix TaxID=2593673 RepID=UPI00345B750A